MSGCARRDGGLLDRPSDETGRESGESQNGSELLATCKWMGPTGAHRYLIGSAGFKHFNPPPFLLFAAHISLIFLIRVECVVLTSNLDIHSSFPTSSTITVNTLRHGSASVIRAEPSTRHSDHPDAQRGGTDRGYNCGGACGSGGATGGARHRCGRRIDGRNGATRTAKRCARSRGAWWASSAAERRSSLGLHATHSIFARGHFGTRWIRLRDDACERACRCLPVTNRARRGRGGREDALVA